MVNVLTFLMPGWKINYSRSAIFHILQENHGHGRAWQLSTKSPCGVNRCECKGPWCEASSLAPPPLQWWPCLMTPRENRYQKSTFWAQTCPSKCRHGISHGVSAVISKVTHPAQRWWSARASCPFHLPKRQLRPLCCSGQKSESHPQVLHSFKFVFIHSCIHSLIQWPVSTS